MPAEHKKMFTPSAAATSSFAERSSRAKEIIFKNSGRWGGVQHMDALGSILLFETKPSPFAFSFVLSPFSFPSSFRCPFPFPFLLSPSPFPFSFPHFPFLLSPFPFPGKRKGKGKGKGEGEREEKKSSATDWVNYMRRLGNFGLKNPCIDGATLKHIGNTFWHRWRGPQK